MERYLQDVQRQAVREHSMGTTLNKWMRGPLRIERLQNDKEEEVDAYLNHVYKGEGGMVGAETVWREDLDLKNHLSGQKRKLLKVRLASCCILCSK